MMGLLAGYAMSLTSHASPSSGPVDACPRTRPVWPGGSSNQPGGLRKRWPRGRGGCSRWPAPSLLAFSSAPVHPVTDPRSRMRPTCASRHRPRAFTYARLNANSGVSLLPSGTAGLEGVLGRPAQGRPCHDRGTRGQDVSSGCPGRARGQGGIRAYHPRYLWVIGQ